MAEYDNKNSGVLFKNEKKQTPNHSDYTGTWTDAAGVEHWLSCWIKESKNGRKFMSLSAKVKEKRS